MEVDGVARFPQVTPDWLVGARIEAGAAWQRAWQAVACHRSQLPQFEMLAAMNEAEKQALWGHQRRVQHRPTCGFGVERDLFAGQNGVGLGLRRRGGGLGAGGERGGVRAAGADVAA